MRYPIALLFAALCATSTFAAETARARLDAFAKDLRSVSAHFEQQAFDPKGGAGKTSRGELALKAPRQFRWDTVAPYAQLIVADGEKVWIYDADLEQVTVRAQGTVSRLMWITTLLTARNNRVAGQTTVPHRRCYNALANHFGR